MLVTPFEVSVTQSKVNAIMARVESYQTFPAPENEQGFAYGMSTKALDELRAHWLNSYDWRAHEAVLNTYPQFTTQIDELSIHFIHVKSITDSAKPLLLTHGWPGSVYEFWDVIPLLSEFDLVIPSLPGYGFSSKPRNPIGPKTTAALWDRLMREGLGYDTYLAQGGDWGAMVTSFIGLNHGTVDGKGGCSAIHLNMMGLRPFLEMPQSDEETAWVNAMQNVMQTEGAYLMEQATKPQTLAMALMDSPVGTAAWITEKFHGWSDLSERGLFDVYTKDQLITNIMIYLVNDAIATSVWYYNGFFQEGAATLPENTRCETPTAFANYPGEMFVPPPRSWAERAYNIVNWSEMDRGGHFAAMEVPEIFSENVKNWARAV